MLKATLLYAFLEKKMFCFIEDSAAIPLEGKKKSATLSLTALFYLNNLQDTLKHQ